MVNGSRLNPPQKFARFDLNQWFRSRRTVKYCLICLYNGNLKVDDIASDISIHNHTHMSNVICPNAYSHGRAHVDTITYACEPHIGKP